MPQNAADNKNFRKNGQNLKVVVCYLCLKMFLVFPPIHMAEKPLCLLSFRYRIRADLII